MLFKNTIPPDYIIMKLKGEGLGGNPGCPRVILRVFVHIAV